MSKSSERFSVELAKYQKDHNNITYEKIIEKLAPQKRYPDSSYLSKFKSGAKKLQKDDCDIFAELFGIRPEYLAGIDDYRTDEDLQKALEIEQEKREISPSLHQILLTLGYIDTYYNNYPLPENTREFLESLADELKEKNISLIVNVNADTYIAISMSERSLVFEDIINYIKFTLEKLFTNNPVYSVTENKKVSHHSNSSSVRSRLDNELKTYKERNKLNNEEIADKLNQLDSSKRTYRREYISRFIKGTKKLSDDDLRTFSGLFGIRFEYLAGIDKYRTDEDYLKAIQNWTSIQGKIFLAFHRILVELEYTDTHKKCDTGSISCISNSKTNTCVFIFTSAYAQLLTDVVNYMAFTLEKFFTANSPMSVPSVIHEDGSTSLHPSTVLALKDGSSVTFKQEFVPNSEYDGNPSQLAFSITESNKK
ncbi:helix-turn-helix domain-containing protein [Brotaphodocola sp.]|uniref:helix-turn-helix domain-containing protein n=1 Tax=Brotaphodocola sp. TaxID=3073577 RepID=UPI003D7CF9A5